MSLSTEIDERHPASPTSETRKDTTSIVTIDSAKHLPDVWDRLAVHNIYLRKAILQVIESAHHYRQKYHILSNPEPDCIFVTYESPKNTAAEFRDRLCPSHRVIGIPCTVSKCGYQTGEKTREAFWQFVSNMRGLKIVVHSDEKKAQNKFLKIPSLPSFRIEVRWGSFNEYLRCMRSHYRYRLNKALRACRSIKVIPLADSSLFDADLYSLYDQVYRRSRFRREKAKLELFRTLPVETMKFEYRGKAIGFVQTLSNGKELLFFKGGMDYSFESSADLYLMMLLEIIKKGLSKGYKSIDLGQTAGEAKMRVGARPNPLHHYVNHSNRIIHHGMNPFLRFVRPRKIRMVDHRIFKAERENDPVQTV